MQELEKFVQIFKDLNFNIEQINRHTYVATLENAGSSRITIWDICNLNCTTVHISMYNSKSKPNRKIIGADYLNYDLEKTSNEIKEFYKEEIK